jgi:predicted acetyltransferase
MSRSSALVLRAFAVWTVYVWVTRIWNIIGDDQSVGFKVVHSVLALVSIGFAVATWFVVRKERRRRSSAVEVGTVSS